MIGNANIPYFGGLIANKISEMPNIDFGVVYRKIRNNKYLYTMRSINKNIDLNTIANKYDGSGHPGAASFIGPGDIFN